MRAIISASMLLASICASVGHATAPVPVIVPADFQGTWVISRENCEQADARDMVTITARSLNGHESEWLVGSVQSISTTKINLIWDSGARYNEKKIVLWSKLTLSKKGQALSISNYAIDSRATKTIKTIKYRKCG